MNEWLRRAAEFLVAFAEKAIVKAKTIKRRTKVRAIFTAAEAIVLGTIIWTMLAYAPKRPATVSLEYSDFVGRIKAGEIKKVVLGSGYGRQEIKGTLPDGKLFRVVIDPAYVKPAELLAEYGVTYTFEDASQGRNPMWHFWWIVGGLASLGIWAYFFWSGISPAGNVSLRFWVASAKRFQESAIKVTFADVAGIEEVKAELQEIVEFLKDPAKFDRLGGRIPKGILLIGPPGNGKTLLAQAAAGEAGVPFFARSGSDFVEKFVGVGASRVRELFNEGKASPGGRCIIYIDEIDGVGGQRTAATSGGDREYQQTLNALLSEMDGFSKQPGIVVMASTNRPEILDEALMRPGRFDRKVFVPQPNTKGREEVLRVHVKKQNVPLGDDVELTEIAQATPGFSGAELAGLVNEAALCATRDEPKRDHVLRRDFIFAKDKILLGLERKSNVRSEEEERIIAHHEAGHAILQALLQNTDPIEKVTTVGRGRTGGGLFTRPRETGIYSKDYLLAHLVVSLGGRVAEDEFLGLVTSGPENDIEKVNDAAWQMVSRWGMSELGPVTAQGGQVDLRSGKRMQEGGRMLSEEALRQIDAATAALVKNAENTARRLLLKHEELYRKLVDMLIEKSTVDGKEIYELAGDLRGSEKAE